MRSDLLTDKGVFPPEDHSVVSRGINELSSLLLKSEFLPLDVNFCFSPFALYAVLAMISEGAIGKTKDEILDIILSSRGNPRYIHQAYAEMLPMLKNDSTRRASNGMIIEDNSMLFANTLFVRTSVHVGDHFGDTLFDCYGSRPLVMSDDPKIASKLVNGYASQHTRGIIREMIDEKFVSNGAPCMLMSAVFFHMKWEVSFKAARPAKFHKLGMSGSVDVPMMTAIGRFKMIDSPIARAIEIPYADGIFTMIIAMAPRNDEQSWKDLTKEYVRFPTFDVPTALIGVQLPRFSLTCKDNLVEHLKELGMQQAFHDEADFTVLSKDKGIKLGAVAHATIINVTETGIRAPTDASVTIEKTYTADAPFVFGVRHNETGMMVMVGQVLDPSVPE